MHKTCVLPRIQKLLLHFNGLKFGAYLIVIVLFSLRDFFFWLVKFQFLNKNTSADECFWDFFFKFNDPSSYSLSMFYVLLAGCFECF